MKMNLVIFTEVSLVNLQNFVNKYGNKVIIVHVL